MVRYRHIIAVVAVVILIPSVAFSQEGRKKGNSTETELAALRKLVEDQSKQIQTLTEQVAHLSLLIETSHTTAAATPEPVAPVAHPAVPVQETTTAPASPVETASVDTPGTHMVTKGETLTSIAKHYKTTVGDLQKVNKIENDRMLQIGQTLVIPSPTPAESPQEKKENQ